MSKPRKNPDPAPGSPTPDELSFEDALEEVESIIERIETGQIGLEASLDAYERGAALIRRCRSVLKNAEQRVDDLGRLMNDDQPKTAPDAGSGGPLDDEDAPF